jgi:2-polyprenyl-3-methyl-5-hydroxy-6-metoxy-1,4-benzoquinol methylase
MGIGILGSEIKSPFTKIKIRILTDIIQILYEKKTLADVGCFDGAFVETYRRCGVESIDGFDMLDEALEAARKAGMRTFPWDFECEKAPVPDLTYDIVVCSDVIEHVYNTENLVFECHRIIRSNGTCIFITPNLCSLWNRFLISLGKMPLGHPGVSVNHKTENQVNLGHSRIGTSKEWSGLFESVGFQVQRVVGMWSGTLPKLVSLGRNELAHSLVFVCSKQRA